MCWARLLLAFLPLGRWLTEPLSFTLTESTPATAAISQDNNRFHTAPGGSVAVAMAALVELISSATPVEVGIVVCIASTLLFLFWTLTR